MAYFDHPRTFLKLIILMSLRKILVESKTPLVKQQRLTQGIKHRLAKMEAEPGLFVKTASAFLIEAAETRWHLKPAALRRGNIRNTVPVLRSLHASKAIAHFLMTDKAFS